MQLLTFSHFEDFELLDTGDGNRLEQWGAYRLVRPDPQIIWQKHLAESEWHKEHAIFEGSGEGGRWIKKRDDAGIMGSTLEC